MFIRTFNIRVNCSVRFVIAFSLQVPTLHQAALQHYFRSKPSGWLHFRGRLISDPRFSWLPFVRFWTRLIGRVVGRMKRSVENCGFHICLPHAKHELKNSRQPGRSNFVGSRKHDVPGRFEPWCACLPACLFGIALMKTPPVVGLGRYAKSGSSYKGDPFDLLRVICMRCTRNPRLWLLLLQSAQRGNWKIFVNAFTEFTTSFPA